MTKLTLVQAIQDHVHNQIECRKSLKASAFAVDAILGQLEAIKEQEQLLHTQILGVRGDMFAEIKNNKDIGNVSENNLVHYKGGSYCSGEDYARAIL